MRIELLKCALNRQEDGYQKAEKVFIQLAICKQVTFNKISCHKIRRQTVLFKCEIREKTHYTNGEAISHQFMILLRGGPYSLPKINRKYSYYMK